MDSKEAAILSADTAFMKLAIAQARQAGERGEVPVGAVVVHGGRVIGRGYNRREEMQSPVAHAEILAIEEAARALVRWRLIDCDLYVTMEPCIMCVGAILQARISRLVFGCLDPKAGAVKSLYRMCDDRRLNHQLPSAGGVLGSECGNLLGDFFTGLRIKKRSLRNAERWPSPVEGA